MLEGDKKILSVVAIAPTSDSEDVKQFLRWTPKHPDIETVVCMNERGSVDSVRERGDKGGLRMLQHTYSGRFSFSEAKNTAIRAARGQWILSLDIDEYLPRHLHEGLTEFVSSIPEYYDAMYCHIASIVNQPTKKKYQGIMTRALRLFRNREDIEFRGHCHELVEWVIPREKHGECELLIHHTGYSVTGEALKRKMVRNIELLCWDVHEIDSETERERKAFAFGKLIDSAEYIRQLP